MNKRYKGCTPAHMDEYSGKRAAGGVCVPRKGSSLVLRDTGNTDRNGQFCNRIGCNGRINYIKGSQVGCSEKAKSSRPAFHSSNRKEMVGSTSRSSSSVTNARKSFQESQKKLSSSSSQSVTESSETSSVRNVLEVPDLSTPSPLGDQNGSQLELIDIDSSVAEATLIEVGSSSVTSNGTPRKTFCQRSGPGKLHTVTGPCGSLASRNASQESSSGSRYNLRNLRYNSISDILPQGCGVSSESNIVRRRDVLKKINSEGECSSSVKGKKISTPASEYGHISHSIGGLSISDSRHSRSWALSRDKSVASVRTRRPVNVNSRIGSSNQANGNNLSSRDSLVLDPQMARPETPNNVNVPSSSRQFTAEASSICSSSSGHSSIGDDNLAMTMSISSAELGITHLVNRDGVGRYNMDVIAEVLLALERIEQDEELTYEQLLALETNLVLGGFNFYDQHRDMRMDIDNMSYEELLALEERMGTVSTALPEDALSKCLRRSFYKHAPPKEGNMGCRDGDDTKCSICQEEYVIVDEVAKLGCDHGYHVACIQDWLRLKNWCPICKASAAPS